MPFERQRVLLFSVHFPPAKQAGGPIRSIAGLVEAESILHDLTVVTSNRDLIDPEPLTFNPFRAPVRRLGANVHYIGSGRAINYVWTIARIGRREFDILHVNSFFSPRFSVLPLVLWRFGIIRAKRVILAPRGELGAAALRVKSRKKLLALPLLRAISRDSRVSWQATSEPEAVDIRKSEPRRSVVRHDNPWPPPLQTVPERPSRPHFVFVGRISDIKNPITALEAFSAVTESVQLTFAGAAEDTGLLETLRSKALSLPKNVSVSFSGHLDADALHELLLGAHALILPTGGENFGHAIAEALAHGCAILIPDTTPWTETVRAGAGFIISASPSRTNAMKVAELSALGTGVLQRVGSRGLALYTDGWQEHERNRGSLYTTVSQSVAGGH